MFKKLLIASFIGTIIILNNVSMCSAGDNQQNINKAAVYFDKAEKYAKNNQYSSAIEEFKKGLRLNPFDINTRIGLINAYLSRAAYYNNKTKEYSKAMIDLRSALFYMKYYAQGINDTSAKESAIANTNNLNVLYQKINVSPTDTNRYQIAKKLRASGELAAAAYEFIQTSSSKSYKKDSLENIGDIYFVMGNYQQASDCYKKLLDEDRTSMKANLKMAKTFDMLNEPELALNGYNYVLSNVNNDRDTLLELERILIKKLSDSPNSADLYTNLGAIYHKMGDYTKAFQQYQKASSLNPKDVTTLLNIAFLYQAQKDYTSAIQEYNKVLKIQPSNLNALTYKAECLTVLKKNDAAVAIYKNILKIDEDNELAKSRIYELTQTNVTPEQALSNSAQEIVEKPQDVQAIYDYAYQLHKANKLDDAILNYKKALQLSPNNPDIYLNLAQAYMEKNDLKNAHAVMTSAMSKFSDNDAVRSYSIQLNSYIASSKSTNAAELYKNGKFRDALEAYKTGDMESTETLMNVASCYLALNENENAITYYKKVLVRSPKNKEASLYMGQAYVNMEDWANAKSRFAKVLLQNPNDAEAKKMMNFVNEKMQQKSLEQALDLYAKANYKSAMAILNNIIIADKNNPQAYYYRALMNDALKNYHLAIPDYKKSIALSPGLKESYYSIAIDYDTLKNYQEALNYYKKYLALVPEDNEYTRYAKQRINEIKK